MSSFRLLIGHLTDKEMGGVGGNEMGYSVGNELDMKILIRIFYF